jgi:glycosyltransferase involved in cell wall biosynthesis
MPVVSTNVGGIPYLLSHEIDALLVADNDVKAMVEAVDRLLTDSRFANQFSLNGRRKATSWDWQTVKKSWEALLK